MGGWALRWPPHIAQDGRGAELELDGRVGDPFAGGFALSQ